MANDEHVALLKQGVAAWNAWRDENPNIRPDLRGPTSSELTSAGANLSGANLSRGEPQRGEPRRRGGPQRGEP